MKKERIKRIASILINFAIVIMTAFSVGSFFTTGGRGNMEVAGFKAFRYYTVDSNVFCAIGCLLLGISSLAGLLRKKTTLPKWAVVLKFAGVNTVMITFWTVIVFLGPQMGFGMMYEGASLYLHGIVPVAAVLSLMLLERGQKMTVPEALLALLPTLVYGTVYFIMVAGIGKANGGWEDFYLFNRGGLWYVTFLVMGVLAAGLALLLRFFYQGRKKKEKKA